MNDEDVKDLFESILGRKLGTVVASGSSEDEDDLDVCEHGIGFDEECSECAELDDEEEE